MSLRSTANKTQQKIFEQRKEYISNSNDFNVHVANSVDKYVSTMQYQIMRMFDDILNHIIKIKESEEAYSVFPKNKKEFNRILRYFFNIVSISYIDYYHNINPFPAETYRAVTQVELDNILNGVEQNGEFVFKTLCSVSTDKESSIEYFKNNKRLKKAIIIFKSNENIPNIQVNPAIVNYSDDTLYSYGKENERIITQSFRIVSIQKQPSCYPPTYIAEIEPIFIEYDKDISYTSLTEKYRKVVKNIGINGEKIDDFLCRYKFNNLYEDDFLEFAEYLDDYIKSMREFIKDRIEKGKAVPFDTIRGEF